MVTKAFAHHRRVCHWFRRTRAAILSSAPLLSYRRLCLESLEIRCLLDSSPFDFGPTYQLYGIDFAPYIAQGEDPGQGDGQITDAELQDRIDAVAPAAQWIRTFGCNEDLKEAGEFAHAAGKLAAMGAWIDADLATNDAQIACLVNQALQGHVDMAIIGSETLLRGDDVSEAQLISYINDVKSSFAGAGLSIPVTTADVYSALLAHPDVIATVDVVFANYYPFWEGWSVDSAIAVLHRQHESLVAASGGKEVIVSETGWPSAGPPKVDAVPSLENAAFYFKNFVSWARAEDVKSFYFEAFDEPWKVEEGRGPHWGLITADLELKEGMRAVFDGETVDDNWTVWPGPPVIDFFTSPSSAETNLDQFLVAGETVHDDDVVKLNGSVVPQGSSYAEGVFTLPVPLNPGTNSLELIVESASGEVLMSEVKTVTYNTNLSTANLRLLYVDSEIGDWEFMPYLDGTIVVAPDLNTILGFMPEKHVRGISPEGSEIYMEDKSVFSTSSHQQLRVLPFSVGYIPSNSFLVSPLGRRLFSRDEIVDVASNTLETTSLPGHITTGNSYGSAAIPGGPAMTSEGRFIFANNLVIKIDTIDKSLTPTNITGTYTSDIALSPDGDFLLVSRYGQVQIYDASTFQLVETILTGGDYGGEIGFVDDGTLAVVGSSGNPVNLGGGVSLIDMTTLSRIDFFASQLADNLETSSDYDEIFVSAGDAAWPAGSRFGVDTFMVDDERRLRLTKTFFLGVNEFYPGHGSQRRDDIRRLVYKSASESTVGIVTDGGTDPNDGVTNDQTLLFTGTAPVYSTVALTSNGESIGTVTADGEGIWSLDRSGTPFAEGDYTIVATASDRAGNVIVVSDDFMLEVDTTAPSVSVDTQTTNDTTPVITGTVSDGTLQVAVNGNSYTAGDGNLSVSGTAWTLQIPAGDALAEGIYDVATSSTDLAGNTGNDPTSDELTIDTTPDDLGMYHNGSFYLDTTGNGVWDKVSGGDTFRDFGINSIRGTGLPVIGDWDGNGTDDLGMYNNGYFYLDTSGNGVWDRVSGGDTFRDFGINSIRSTGLPVIGDWDGNGTDDLGMYNNGYFYLDTSGNGVWDRVSGGDTFRDFGINSIRSTGLPVIGDWDGNDTDDLGMYNNGYFYLDTSGNGVWDRVSGGDTFRDFGINSIRGTGLPVIGDWDGNGTDDLGMYNNGCFYLDTSGNGVWDRVSGGDTFRDFGINSIRSTARPVVGMWASASPLRAIGGLAAEGTQEKLTLDALTPIVDQAIALWASGPVQSIEHRLESVEVRIADLPSVRLGEALGTTITIDINAAGHGWFVDATPRASDEFNDSTAQGLVADPSGPAADRMDLLTVALHELGHLLGHGDLDDILSDDIMEGWLPVGVRRM